MRELEILGVVFSVMVGIAVIVIAFDVVAIRRAMERRGERSDTPDPPSPRT